MVKPEFEVVRFNENVLTGSADCSSDCPKHCAPDCSVVSPECQAVCWDYCCNTIDD